MSSDDVALVVAGISGAVSLIAAIGVGLLQSRSSHHLEELKSAQALDLEKAKDELARVREAATRDEESARVVAKYRDPLLRSAYDLQSRIYNVYRPGGFRGGRDPEYFRLNTLFLFAEFLAWLEIIRREVQFLDVGAVEGTKELSRMLQAVQEQMSTTSGIRDDLYLYRGQQRAIGELMLVSVGGQTAGGPRYECMGYAAFVAAQKDPAFAKWFERLGDAIDRIRETSSHQPERLVRVQHALIDLIDLLDPDRDRFVAGRERLSYQSHDAQRFLQLQSEALAVRRSVKTGSDGDIKGLMNQTPTPTTIAALCALPIPPDLPADERAEGAESTIWQVDATLIHYSLDYDELGYGLVVSDENGNTMIAVIPDPAALPSESFFADSVAAAGQAFIDRFELQSDATPRRDVPAEVTITGIGFFEFAHGQSGIAPNGFSLYPVLDISFHS